MTETHIGQYLKRERELRKIPLDYIVNSTKITPRYLNAIEEGDFSALPGKIFLKGFVKSYAKCIGLEPNEVLLRLEDAEKEIAPKNKATVPLVRKRLLRISGFMIFVVMAAIVTALAAWFSLK